MDMGQGVELGIDVNTCSVVYVCLICFSFSVICAIVIN